MPTVPDATWLRPVADGQLLMQNLAIAMAIPEDPERTELMRRVKEDMFPALRIYARLAAEHEGVGTRNSWYFSRMQSEDYFVTTMSTLRNNNEIKSYLLGDINYLEFGPIGKLPRWQGNYTVRASQGLAVQLTETGKLRAATDDAGHLLRNGPSNFYDGETGMVGGIAARQTTGHDSDSARAKTPKKFLYLIDSKHYEYAATTLPQRFDILHKDAAEERRMFLEATGLFFRDGCRSVYSVAAVEFAGYPELKELYSSPFQHGLNQRTEMENGPVTAALRSEFGKALAAYVHGPNGMFTAFRTQYNAHFVTLATGTPNQIAALATMHHKRGLESALRDGIHAFATSQRCLEVTLVQARKAVADQTVLPAVQMGVPKEAWLGALERWMETDTWKIALEEEQTARVAARAQENNGRLKTREEIWDADVFMRMADPRVIVELLPSQTDESLFGKVRHRLANAELSAEDIAVCMRLKLVLSYKMPGDDPDHVAVIFSGEMGRFANAAENVKAVITWIEGDRVATTADEWKKRGVTKENLNMAKQFPDFAEQYGSKGTRKRVKMAKGSASEPLPPPSPAGSEPLLPAAVGAAEPHVLPAVNVVDPVLAQGFSVDLAAVDPNGPAVEAVGAPLEDPTVPAAPSSPLGMSKLVKQGLIPTLSNTNKSNVQSSFKIAFYNVGDLTLGFPADRYRKWKESIEWGQRQAAISERLHRERDEKEAKANARRKAESKPPPKSKVQVTHRHVFREIADVRVDVEILPQTSADSYFYKLRHAMAVLPGLHTAQRDVLNQLKLTLRMKMPDNMPPVTVACRYDEERIRLKPETLQRIANMLLDSLGIPLPAAAASAPAASTETAAAAVPAASVAPTKPAVVEVSVAIPAPTRAPSSAAPKSLPTSQNFQQRKLFDAPLAATAPPRPKASAQAAPSAKPAKQQVKLSFAKTDAVSKKGPKTPEPTVPTRTQYSEMPQTAPALHTSSGVDLATETELGPVNETVLAEAIKDYRFDGDEAAMAAAADEIEMALEAALRHVDDPMMVDD